MGGKSILINRVLSAKSMPAGLKTCNGKRAHVDGYCQLPGLKPFGRCAKHHGVADTNSLDLFKKSLPLEQATQLDTLIRDTMNMDNEVATAKSMLLAEIETYHRSVYALEQFTTTMPQRPNPEKEADNELEAMTYKEAVYFHTNMMDHLETMKKVSFYNAVRLMKLINESVSKNAKMKESGKFVLDVRQIARIIEIQLTAMKQCQGCPKLKNIITYIKEHTKDIPVNPNFTKSEKSVIGKQVYEDMIHKVEADTVEVEEAEVIEDD